MRKGIIIFLFIIFNVMILSSCSSVGLVRIKERTDSYTYDRVKDSNKGYIYAKFTGTEKRFVFYIKDEESGHEEVLEFFDSFYSRPDEYQIYALNPGTYRLSKYKVWSVRGSTEFKDKKYSKPFKVESNKRYYLGDFTVEVKSQVSYGYRQSVSFYFYKIKKVEDKFNETTKVISKKYPKLNNLPSARAFK